MTCSKNENQLKKIYQQIYQKEYINLDKLMLCGLSIRKYRKYYNIPETDYVDIFFDNGMEGRFYPKNYKDVCLEFAWCRFHCKDSVAGISFNSSIFKNGYIDFSYSIFVNDLVFDDCTFNSTNLYFIGCNFKNNEFRFYNAYFVNANIYIHSSEFINQETNFNFSNFKNTYFQFINNTCNNAELLFTDINENSLIDGEYLFIMNTLENSIIDFQNTFLDKLLFYNMSFNTKTNLNICFANYITIQQCINRDILIIGNEGYKNISNICLKDTINFGQILIKNHFTEKLFKQQKKIYLDKSLNKGENDKYYKTNITFPISLCDTSDEEKYMQFTVLQSNEETRGNSNLSDKYYLLARKYKNRSKISNKTIQILQLKNSKNKFNKSKYIIEFILIIFQIILGVISYLIEKIILETLCGSYATKPYKFLLSVIMLILLFTQIYLYFGIDVMIFTTQSKFINALLYSIQNFFPVAIITQSSGTIHLITIFEEILGTIVLSLFTVSYTRKVIK